MDERLASGLCEADIQQAILIEFGSRPGLRIWRSNAGAARTRTGALVRFGVPGQADLSGIIAPHGRRLEIEVKSATGRQSDQQRKFQEMIESMGGIYILARSLEDVRNGLL